MCGMSERSRPHNQFLSPTQTKRVVRILIEEIEKDRKRMLERRLSEVADSELTYEGIVGAYHVVSLQYDFIGLQAILGTREKLCSQVKKIMLESGDICGEGELS